MERTCKLLLYGGSGRLLSAVFGWSTISKTYHVYFLLLQRMTMTMAMVVVYVVTTVCIWL